MIIFTFGFYWVGALLTSLLWIVLLPVFRFNWSNLPKNSVQAPLFARMVVSSLVSIPFDLTATSILPNFYSAALGIACNRRSVWIHKCMISDLSVPPGYLERYKFLHFEYLLRSSVEFPMAWILPWKIYKVFPEDLGKFKLIGSKFLKKPMFIYLLPFMKLASLEKFRSARRKFPGSIPYERTAFLNNIRMNRLLSLHEEGGRGTFSWPRWYQKDVSTISCMNQFPLLNPICLSCSSIFLTHCVIRCSGASPYVEWLDIGKFKSTSVFQKCPSNFATCLPFYSQILCGNIWVFTALNNSLLLNIMQRKEKSTEGNCVLFLLFLLYNGYLPHP